MSGAPDGDTRLRELSWVAVDLEMTGLDPMSDRICEVGVASGRPGEALEVWESLIDPGVPVDTPAQAVHGIVAADLVDAPRFPEVAASLRARLRGRLCVAHRADVDRRFLTDAFARAGWKLSGLVWIDTLEVARRLLVLPRHRLADVCVALGVPAPTAHRAGEDAVATWHVWAEMVELLDPDGTLTVDGLWTRLDQLAPGSVWRKAQLDTLREAHEAQRAVRIEYLSRDPAGRLRITHREFDVWKISPPRIEGFCHLRSEARIFRMERIREVQMLARTYEIPEFRARI